MMTFDSLYQLVLENAAVRDYSCLMLDLSFLKDEFESLQEGICPCDLHDEDGHGLETEIHVTCAYGFSETKAYDVFSILSLKPISFRIGKLSLFTNERYDVLKFDIHSKDLMVLNEEINKKFIIHTDYPKYIPHMTVAYLRPKSGKLYTRLRNKLHNKQFTSNRFIFSNPNGEKVWLTV